MLNVINVPPYLLSSFISRAVSKQRRQKKSVCPLERLHFLQSVSLGQVSELINSLNIVFIILSSFSLQVISFASILDMVSINILTFPFLNMGKLMPISTALHLGNFQKFRWTWIPEVSDARESPLASCWSVRGNSSDSSQIARSNRLFISSSQVIAWEKVVCSRSFINMTKKHEAQSLP